MSVVADRSASEAGASRLRSTGSAGSSGDPGEPVPGARSGESREVIVEREKREHGGLKIGATFFGWLTATGMAVLLTALAAAAGTAVGVATDTDAEQAADLATRQLDTVGLVGGIVLLAIILLSYFAGGYVAGRMARFNGLKQGLGVWLWALVVALLVAGAGAIAGAEYNVLQRLDSFPRLPVNEGTLTTGGLVALVVAVLAALVGAVLGGLAGMRFHRKVDRTGLGR